MKRSLNWVSTEKGDLIRTYRTVRTPRTVRIFRGGNEIRNHSNELNSKGLKNPQINKIFKSLFSKLTPSRIDSFLLFTSKRKKIIQKSKT